MTVSESGREHLFTLADGGFLAEIDFEITSRGYQRHQVERYVVGLQRQLAQVTRRATETAQRLSAREAELAMVRVQEARRDPSPATAPPSQWLGWRLERVLSLAEDDAERIRTEARAEAARTLADAALEADRMRAAARRERDDLRRRAAALHDRLAAMGQELADLNDERADGERAESKPAGKPKPRRAA